MQPVEATVSRPQSNTLIPDCTYHRKMVDQPSTSKEYLVHHNAQSGPFPAFPDGA